MQGAKRLATQELAERVGERGVLGSKKAGTAQ